MKKFSYRTAIIVSAAVVISAQSALAGVPAPPPVNVPTFSEWGLIGAAVTLGAAGIYSIFKRK